MGKRRSHQPRLHSDAHISIVGCGLSGLASAIALEEQGFKNVHIYERDASMDARREGYGLTLTYNPKGVLAQLGILEEVALADCPSRSHYLFGTDGSIRGYFGNAFAKHRGWGQRGNLRVPRQKLRSILFSRIKSTQVHWGCSLVGFARDTSSDKDRYRLEFAQTGKSRTTTIDTELLIAADGIRSTVVNLVWPNAPPATAIGVRLILGITEHFVHPHLHERGFYTLGNGMRLFVMPFSSPAWNTITDNPYVSNGDRRYMWQLSFLDDDETRYTSDELYQEAKSKCKGWHDPVLAMLESTKIESVWGAMLFDRDPKGLRDHITKAIDPPRVLVIGDACHGMSCFKGQGANQSLVDGAGIYRHFLSSGIDAAVKVTQQDVCQRTASVVSASREAAQYWHSPSVLDDAEHSFAGVVDAELTIDTIRRAGVSANSTLDLDSTILTVLEHNDLITNDTTGKDENDKDCEIQHALCEEASQAAKDGNLEVLRRISWQHGSTVLRMCNCINDAISNKHERCVHWLQHEAGCTIGEQ